MRVILTPSGEISLARYIPVASPSTLGFVATMISAMPSAGILASSSAIRRSSGPTPSMGEMAPPSTW